MTFTLKISERTEKGKKLQALRAEGKLPAVVYGPKHEAMTISLDAKEFDKIFKEAGESSVLVLTGAGEDIEVLVQDVTYSPVKSRVEHVDFYAIEKGKEVTVNVPLEFTGEAPATKLGGSLTKALHEVEITCKPAKLPHEIVVDVSSLNTFEDSILVKDLNVPDGVTVTNDPEETVAFVAEAKEEEEEPVSLDMDAIEVEKKGKEETEEETEK
ncbi:50S ribosomal protein L25 [Candidatus Nomurabacteria bacterium]|nr:50S ribosomal protein L25 [Candidatus Nomurabacteria bacterium]